MSKSDDLISRQWLTECVNEGWIKFDTEKDKNRFIHLVRDIAPSAQPEIIRCRDCKYWREHKYAKETQRYIPFCGFNAIYTKADDFCSKGTRRTGCD